MTSNNLGELLKKLQETASARVDAKMAEEAKLFMNEEDQDKVINSKWSRDNKGKLFDGTTQIDDKTTVGQNVADCVTNNNEDLTNCVSNDIKSPLEASLILQKLGFKVVEKMTTLGRLKLVESVESWKQRNEMRNSLPSSIELNLTTKNLSSAAEAKLKSMVELVNMNPSILNKGWKPPKMTGDKWVPPEEPTPTTRPKEDYGFVWLSGGGNVEGEVEAINNVIKSDSFAIKLGAGLETAQLGGGEKEYALSLDQIDDKSTFALRGLYHDLRNRLKQNGKELDSKDEKVIEEQLNKFETTRRRLLLSIELLKAMNDLVEKGLVTKDKIPFSEVYDKQHHLVKKVEDRKKKVMVILSSLGTAVALEEPTTARKTTLTSTGHELPVPADYLSVEV